MCVRPSVTTAVFHFEGVAYHLCFDWIDLSIAYFIRNDITTLALYGHGSETILFFSMGHGKVIYFPIIIWFYKHFL